MKIVDREKESIEETARLLTAAVEQAAESIVITDAHRRIQYVNPAFERLTGYVRSELIGRTPRILHSGRHEESFYQAIVKSLERGETWHGRIADRRKDGSIFELATSISPLRDADGEVVNYIAVGRDVTRELQFEYQYRQAQKMKAIGHLAGGVAHDFNNLLQAIRGYTDLALLALPRESPAREDLGEVLSAIDRARELIRQLLSFSRREGVQCKYLNLDSVISETVTMLRRVLGEQIEVITQFDSAFRTIYVDPSQIEQILMNLCVNARDAMPEGGSIRIATETVHLDSQFVKQNPFAREGDFVRMSLTDTGMGMSPEILEHIFEPFFTTKEISKGTGLGLATVYGIIKQHSGFIHVESVFRKGTSFHIYLPSLQHEATMPERADEQAEPVGGNETILLAEDDEPVRSLVRRILETAGYKVLSASDGEQAIKEFSRSCQVIQLAVLDVVMPKMSGKLVGEHIRSQNPQTPILFASGYDFNILDAGFTPGEEIEIIYKPFDFRELLSRVRKALDAQKRRSDTANTEPSLAAGEQSK